MRPEKKSQLLLGVTRSKAKMLEYGVPEEHHIKITQVWALVVLTLYSSGSDPPALEVLPTHSSDCDPPR